LSDNMMKFLEKRDDHFDFCKSMIVLGMINAHIFLAFYTHFFSLTYRIINLSAFIFLSGTTSTVLSNYGRTSLLRTITRAGKLIGIFAISNLMLLLLSRTRYEHLFSGSGLQTLLSLFLGTKQAFVALDVLVPIAFTMLVSIFFVHRLIWYLTIAYACACLLILYAIESYSLINFYTIKLIFIGQIGSALGNWFIRLDWGDIAYKYFRPLPLLGLFIIISCYFLFVPLHYRNDVPFSYALLPTVLSMFFLYLFSSVFRLSSFLIVRLLNRTLAKNMLFAYIFHIIINQLLLFILKQYRYPLFPTIILSLLLIFITISACFLVNYLTEKYPIFKLLYGLIFK